MLKYNNYQKEFLKQNKGDWQIIDELGQMATPHGYSISVFRKLFYLFWDKGFFWFRFLDGYGLWGTSNKRKRVILFSERKGLVKTYKLLGWTFKFLNPSKK